MIEVNFFHRTSWWWKAKVRFDSVDIRKQSRLSSWIKILTWDRVSNEAKGTPHGSDPKGLRVTKAPSSVYRHSCCLTASLCIPPKAPGSSTLSSVVLWRETHCQPNQGTLVSTLFPVDIGGCTGDWFNWVHLTCRKKAWTVCLVVGPTSGPQGGNWSTTPCTLARENMCALLKIEHQKMSLTGYWFVTSRWGL